MERKGNIVRGREREREEGEKGERQRGEGGEKQIRDRDREIGEERKRRGTICLINSNALMVTTVTAL